MQPTDERINVFVWRVLDTRVFPLAVHCRCFHLTLFVTFFFALLGIPGTLKLPGWVCLNRFYPFQSSSLPVAGRNPLQVAAACCTTSWQDKVLLRDTRRCAQDVTVMWARFCFPSPVWFFFQQVVACINGVWMMGTHTTGIRPPNILEAYSKCSK